MNEYMVLLAVLLGILASILLRWKDIKEILKMHKEIREYFESL